MKSIRMMLLAALFLLLVSLATEAKQCRSLHSPDNWREIQVFEESLTIPFSGDTLHVTPSKNGGVNVTGTSESGDWEITVCKTRWRDGSDIDPSEIEIRATTSALAVEPFDEEGWSVFFLVEAPRQASMTASTINGPISLSDVSGTYSVESKNGPLSLKNVEGNVVARLRNGPIAFENLSGEFDLETANGPISADFRDWTWRGGSIKAATGNGPLSLRSTASFPAGILLKADGQGPIRCEQECGEIWRDPQGRQQPRIFRFGPATEDVVLTTGNGPVVIDVTPY